MEFILNTARMVDNDQAKEFIFGNEITLEQKLAIAFLNAKDFEKLKLKPNLNLKISNQNGEITVKALIDEDVPQRTVLMPVSIWSNQLVSIVNEEINYKNIKVNLESTSNSIIKFKELLNRIKGNK